MKMLLLVCMLSALSIISACCLNLYAEENGSNTDSQELRLTAALALFTTMDMETIYNTSFEQTLRTTLQQNPMMAKKSEQLLAFYKKNLGWSVMRDGIAASYAQKFSLAELKDIEVFYNSDVGKKLAAAQSELTAQAQKISQEKSQKLMPELMKIIQSP